VDPDIVDWDRLDYPSNPQNFSPRKKWSNITVLYALTFLTALASSMFAPGVPELLHDFHVNNEALKTFVVALYLLVFAAGPLVVAPMSELYRR
jgi:MFS family permease